VSGELGDETLKDITDTDGVAATRVNYQMGAELNAGSRSDWGMVNTAPPSEDMLTNLLESGSLPTADDEAAIRVGAASRLGVALGDSITLTSYQWSEDGEELN